MSFIETPRFPEIIAAGSQFGPAYSTDIAGNKAGYEASNQNWSMPLYKGNVAQAVRSQAQLDDLLAFFHSVAGRQGRWRFKNFNDYQATGAQGTLVNLTSTTWQMYKTYTMGAISKARKISKPCATGITIAGSGSYTYSSVTGVITKSSGADPTGWTGPFDFPCRFDTDEMLPQWLSFELYDWTSIPIVEVRL